MNNKKKLISGFVAFNNGTIQDCYSAVRIKAKQPISGFCAQNTGHIKNSVFQGKLQSSKNTPKSGLCAQQKGRLEDCFWVRQADKPEEDPYTDWDLSLAGSDLEAEELPELLSRWDMAHTWHCEKGILALYNDDAAPIQYENVVEIHDEEDLLGFAISVNEGTVNGKTLFRLMQNIDLHGQEWTPIGVDPDTAFRGAFDGAGFCIKNFRVKTQKHPYAGLFGCIAKSAFVFNLTVDCILSGEGNYSGPICGQNCGTIHNCIARAQNNFSRYTGGFAGRNEGAISNSCALGNVSPVFLWWLPPAGIMLLAAILCFSLYLHADANPPQEVFPPVIIDPNAKPMPDDIKPPNHGETSSSNATFIMNAEMSMSTENYAGAIGLRCPSWSNCGFVVTVRVAGRDLNANGVAASDEFYTLYRSGLIKPGFGIEVITLGALPDGTRLPSGTYEFSVLFEFYNIETNEKSVIDSVAPLDVVIH